MPRTRPDGPTRLAAYINHAPADRETETRAARTRRKERRPRARADLRVHALAGVAHLDDHARDAVLARRLGAHGQRAAAAHRLTCVLHEVVEDLAKHVRVS